MLTALRAQAARLQPLTDTAIALAVLALSVQPLVSARQCGCDPAPAWGFALVAAQAAPLIVRRRWPFAVTLVIGVFTAWYGLSSLPDPPVTYAGLVAVYTVAAYGSRREARLSAVIAAVSIAISFAIDWGNADYQDFTVIVATYITAFTVGEGTRTRRERAAELEQRALQLERTRAAEAETAVVAERNRIARELHDAVAHHVSMMVVQAEAGPVAIARDPQLAADAFDTISSAGKQALVEMRALLGVLKDDRTGAREPQPGIAQVGDLVSGAQAAGLDVGLTVDGATSGLPLAISLAAYRVVQESLTNCLRHAPSARVEVRVACADQVVVEVADTGPAAPSSRWHDRSGSTGHGLAAMRERISLAGGTLEAGPHAGGWRVHAILPGDPGAAA